MSFHAWVRFPRNDLPRGEVEQRRDRCRGARRLQVEQLEDRCLPTTGLSASLVADIVPGAASSYPDSLTVVNGTLYFNQVENGPGLWKSDGTAAGTMRVGNVFADFITPVGGRLFFVDNYRHLWCGDGTSTAAVQLTSFPIQNSTVYPFMTGVGGKLYFKADVGQGVELWTSDGTPAGTTLVKDLYPGTSTVTKRIRDPYTGRWERNTVTFVNSSSPDWLTNLNGTLFFAATDGTNGRELWRSDGTAQGTVPVKDISTGSQSSDPQYLTTMDGQLYFSAAGGLWKSDGTEAGSVLVRQLQSRKVDPNIANLTAVNGTLYFSADDGAHGAELWRSDGTAAGTTMVSDIASGGVGSNPDKLTNINGVLFFTATDGIHGAELWKSDGTPASTRLIADINPGSASSNVYSLTNVNGLVYFSADDGAHGFELWQSDGTPAGTVMVQDIYPGPIGSSPFSMVAFNNKLYFSAEDPVHGRELWDPPPVGNDGGRPPSAYTPGPLRVLSSPDPLPSAPPGFGGVNVAAEPYVAVNPTNPRNIVAVWMDHPFVADVASVTFDGGDTWRNVPIPVSQAEGGPFGFAGNAWVSFAPNGELYASSGSVPVNKSTDGGLTWSQPIQVNTDTKNSRVDDKPSITADPTADPADPNYYVYATWARLNKPLGNANNTATMFARSTDGGRTWESARDIHDASGGDFNWGHQIVVLPNGTLIDAFTEGQFKNNHDGVLTLLRSTDHGQTWSSPIRAVVQRPLVDPNAFPPTALVTDPDTGVLVDTHPMFPSVAVDRQSGMLYAVWIDGRFSNFQYNGIALSMSADGGLTWSQPIQANQTPITVSAIARQAFNPAVAVAADGTIAVTYYDFRNNTSAPGALTDYWLAYCSPSARVPATGTVNWREVRLTDTSFNLEQAPSRTSLGFTGSFDLGDYEGLAAVGNDFVAAWGMPDGSATSQESIFFRRAMASSPLLAATVSDNLVKATLSPQYASLLPEKIRGWHAAGSDTASLAGIDVRSTDVDVTGLGMDSGNARWLVANAVGWRWPADRTPREDRSFATPGDRDEQSRRVLRTVLSRKTDQLLSSEYHADGLMAEALAAGTRRVPYSGSDLTDVAANDQVFADSGTNFAAPLLDGPAPRRY